MGTKALGRRCSVESHCQSPWALQCGVERREGRRERGEGRGRRGELRRAGATCLVVATVLGIPVSGRTSTWAWEGKGREDDDEPPIHRTVPGHLKRHASRPRTQPAIASSDRGRHSQWQRAGAGAGWTPSTIFLAHRASSHPTA